MLRVPGPHLKAGALRKTGHPVFHPVIRALKACMKICSFTCLGRLETVNG